MRSYYRFLPEKITWQDFSDALDVAVRVARGFSDAEVTLICRNPQELINISEGVLSREEIRRLVTGGWVKYHHVRLNYAGIHEITAINHTALAINCIPEIIDASEEQLNYLVVVATMLPDIYSLEFDFWILQANPRGF